MKAKKGNLLIGFVILIIVILLITLIGIFAIKKQPVLLQGEAEATEVRVSGKVPGRILHLLVEEGTKVTKGDTLVFIDSPEIIAKMQQAQASESVARSQNEKAIKGARKELILGAYEQWQKSLVGVELAKKSFNRVQNLFEKGVMPAQKRDEAEANYKAAEATEKAAKSQYDMAMNGAEKEDKEAAFAMVSRAKGAVAEVESYLSEISLTAPISGEISNIYPKTGELVGTGAPIMSIVDLDDAWVVFNVREDFLSKITVGRVMKGKIPALGNTEVELKVYYIKAMASYATWQATKVSGQYDSKTFEVRARPTSPIKDLRPGMTVLVEWANL